MIDNSNENLERNTWHDRKIRLASFYKVMVFICLGFVILFLHLTILPIPKGIYNLKLAKFFLVEFALSFPYAMVIAHAASFQNFKEETTRRLFTALMCFCGALELLINVVAIFWTNLIG